MFSHLHKYLSKEGDDAPIWQHLLFMTAFLALVLVGTWAVIEFVGNPWYPEWLRD